MPQIWIEIDDFVRSLEWSLASTGIQRVQMEIISRLIARPDQHVFLMRLGREPGEYQKSAVTVQTGQSKLALEPDGHPRGNSYVLIWRAGQLLFWRAGARCRLASKAATLL